MLDWRLLCHKRKKLFKLSSMSSRTPPATRHSPFLLNFLKSLCINSGTLSRRVQGVDFTEVPNDKTTLTFLIDLGYKGPLYKHHSILKFVRISKDFQEYGLPILETMLTKGTKQSYSYQMFIKYSTDLLPPKNIRGKGSQRKKTTDTPKANVDVSEESDSEPARKRTCSRRVIKKKVSISVDNNIIPDLDVALERRPSGIAFKDTSSVSKKMSPDLSQKLKGIQTLTLEENPVVDTMEALKSNRKSIGKQESEYFKEGDDDENIKWVDTDEEEDENDDDDNKNIDLEKTDDEETDDEFVHSKENVQDDDEETDDEFVHGDEQVNDDEDEEMKNVEDADIGNGDEEMTDAVKEDAEKTEEAKDDSKTAELPPTSSSLSVSLGFGNQFLNLSFDICLIGTAKDTTDDEINSLLDVQIQQEIPHIQSASILTVLVFVISKPSVLTPIPKTPSVAPAITLLPPLFVSTISHVLMQSTTPIPAPPITTEAPCVTTILDLLHVVIQRVSVLEKDVQELKETGNTTTHRASLRSGIPSVVNAYLGSSLGNSLQKMILFDKMDKICSYLTHDKHEVLFDVLLNSIVLDDAVARGQADPEKVLRKRYHDDDDPSAGPNQGKKTKRSRTKEFEPSKKSFTSKEPSKEEPVEELIFEMASDDIEQTVDDVANDADQPPDDSTQTKDKDLKKDCMLLKGTCISNIELYYNMEECFKELTNKLDWNNLEGDPCPFDLTKPLSLKGRPSHLIVTAEYFFNNDLEFLKSLDLEKRYTTPITKTKVARYEIVGIEDMVHMLWSTTKLGYNKDAEKGIKHWRDKRQLWYRSQLNKFSKHKVYSTQKILSVVSVNVKKLHGCVTWKRLW
nr:hypothetical protein [Tanacetum cinerariifolium]